MSIREWFKNKAAERAEEERELIMLETNLGLLEKALKQKNDIIRTLENTLYNLMKTA